MNVGKLKTLKAWFPHPEDPTVRVLIRHVPQDEYDAIYDECTRLAVAESGEFSLAGGLPETVIDQKSYRSALGRAAVLDFTGYTDGDDDHPYACTPEAIDYLMEVDGGFRLLVRTKCLSFQAVLAAEKAALEKN